MVMIAGKGAVLTRRIGAMAGDSASGTAASTLSHSVDSALSWALRGLLGQVGGAVAPAAAAWGDACIAHE